MQFADRLTNAKNWNTSLNIDIEPISDQLFQTSKDSLLNPPVHSNAFEWCSVNARLTFFNGLSPFLRLYEFYGESRTSFYQSFTDFFRHRNAGWVAKPRYVEFLIKYFCLSNHTVKAEVNYLVFKSGEVNYHWVISVSVVRILQLLEQFKYWSDILS